MTMNGHAPSKAQSIMVPVAAFHRMLDVKSRQQIVAAELVRRLQDEGAVDISAAERVDGCTP
jgi:hypothetical protein